MWRKRIGLPQALLFFLPGFARQMPSAVRQVAK
jgi:hypothetical protein